MGKTESGEREDWRRIFELIEAALDMAEPERAVWMARLEASGERLAPRLRAVLDSRARIETARFMNAPARLTLVPEAVAVLHPGAVVGAYRLVRELAAGGMGTVWLARRADGMFDRPVALKLPHAGLPGNPFAQRFARERAILAALAHPHIARLYDAGVSEHGQPFVALEYIDGEPLTVYCDRAGLGIAGRVRLFVDVLRAVQFAHGRLIVHRDLKPTNVLVDTEGQIKLLDFGIAKLIGDDDQGDLTLLHGRVATPAYASPEQISGGPIGVASDIYSAGVVLYELLTAQRPYRLGPDGRAGLQAAIAEGRIVAPAQARITDAAAAARATTPRQLKAMLAGDLGTVLSKALKPAPAERYATAEAFAQDLEHWLRHEPIRARPDTVWYRARKFVARNRFTVATAAAGIAALALGLAAALWQAQQARQQAARAEEIRRFVLTLFVDANPVHGGSAELRAVDLLSRARERIERELQGRPREQVELLCTVGVSLSNLSAIAEARAAYESAARIGPIPAGCLVDHAIVLMASDALDAAARLLALAEPELRAAAPSVELGKLLSSRSALLRIHRDFDAALAAAAEAAAVTRAATHDGSRDHVNTLLQLGRIQFAAGRFEDAVATAEEGLEKLPRAVGTAQHPDMPLFRVIRASALSELGRHDEAVRTFEAALPEIARAFGVESQEHVVDLYYYALAQRRRGDLPRAIALLSQSTALARKAGLANEMVSVLLDALAVTHLAARDGTAAYTAALEATTLATSAVGPGHPAARSARASLAFAQALRGQLAESAATLQELLQGPEATAADSAMLLHYLGEIDLLAGRAAEALPRLAEAARRIEGGSRRRRAALPAARTALARALLELQRVDEAAAQLQLVRGLLDESRALPTPVDAEAHTATARVYLARAQPRAAIEHAARADAFWRQFDPGSRWAAEAAYWHGRCLAAAGNADGARKAYARARTALAASPFPADRALLRDIATR
jgi:serine/threonine protein kinase